LEKIGRATARGTPDMLNIDLLVNAITTLLVTIDPPASHQSSSALRSA
jgi:hypothetical protein